MDITSPILERKDDDRHGSLFPPPSLPVATRVVDSGNDCDMNDNEMAVAETQLTAVAALPVETFNYDDAITAEQNTEQQQVAYYVPGGIDTLEAEAPRSAAIADDSSQRVRYSTQIGVIRSEEELDAIRKANLKVYSQTYNESVGVQNANENAKRRDREGLQVHSHGNSTTANSSSSSSSYSHSNDNVTYNAVRSRPGSSSAAARNATTTTSSNGYRTMEYKIGDTYETKPYNVSEYKSVYD